MMGTYLCSKSNGSYAFRKKVPIPLRGVIGKVEIKIKLNTRNPAIAERQAGRLAERLDELFLQLQIKGNHMRQLEPEKIYQLIRKQLQEWLKLDEDIRISGVSKHTHPDDQNAELCFLNTLQGEHTAQLVGQLYFSEDISPAMRERDFLHTQPISETVDTMLVEAGIKLLKKSHSYRTLCRQLLRFMIPYFEILKSRAGGDYDQADEEYGKLMGKLDIVSGLMPNNSGTQVQVQGFTSFQQKRPIPIQPEQNSASLCELIKRFEKEHKDQKETTMRSYLESFNSLLDIIGDFPIHEIDRNKIIEYRDACRRLPKNRNKLKRYRDKNIRQLLKMDIPEQDRLHPSTINKHLTRLYTLFDEAINLYQLHPGPNPVIKVKIKTQALDKDSRTPFSESELKKLFHSDQYQKDSFKKPYQFWCPLIALLHGLRSRELAQLYIADIRQEEGVWIFDLNTDTPDKSLKNKTAFRKVPIHPWFIDGIGFLNFVKSVKAAGHDRLFPELKFSEKEGYGKPVGRWFYKYRQQVGIKPDPQGRLKDFHSLRKNFVTHLVRKGIPWNIRLCVEGHSGPQDETATYFEGYRPGQMLAEVIEKVTFHQDLELDHLKDNRWVRG